MVEIEDILILTPVRNASTHAQRYFELIRQLVYPKSKISIGILEGDSDDGTFDVFSRCVAQARHDFSRVNIWKKDFHLSTPVGSARHAPEYQLSRRSTIARARNHLLFNALEPNDKWVLWIDADLVAYPPSILKSLLASGRHIVQPDCIQSCNVSSARPPSFDRNAWRERGVRHLDSLRDEGPLVRLDAVGGTMLLVNADVHRDGLIFPAFPYGVSSPLIRVPGQNLWHGEIETEGLGIMAADMGLTCWGITTERTIHL